MKKNELQKFIDAGNKVTLLCMLKAPGKVVHDRRECFCLHFFSDDKRKHFSIESREIEFFNPKISGNFITAFAYCLFKKFTQRVCLSDIVFFTEVEYATSPSYSLMKAYMDKVPA